MNRSSVKKSMAKVTPVTLADLFVLWSSHRQKWQWDIPFVTPPWLAAWWNSFADEGEAFLLQITMEDRPIGAAPLMRQGTSARFMGSADLCDYGDLPVAPDSRDIFCQTLLHYLKEKGILHLVLKPVRPDSLVRQVLVPIARQCGWDITIKPISTSLQMSLPTTWDNYLQNLDPKQRHEVRRKMRRLDEAGKLELHVIRRASDIDTPMDIFIKLFIQSRPDKKEFMTARREIFFRTLAEQLSHADMLKLFYLTIDQQPAAAVFCVDYNKTTYLYNNGFDPQFRPNSLGLVSKLMTIRAGIEATQQTYDFLCGTERYKYELGGKEMPLSSCVFHYG